MSRKLGKDSYIGPIEKNSILIIRVISIFVEVATVSYTSPDWCAIGTRCEQQGTFRCLPNRKIDGSSSNFPMFGV